MESALLLLRKTVLETAHPVLPYLGKIEWPVHRLLGAQQWRDLLSNPEFIPGCVLLTRKRLALSNLFIPGEWKHAAIYVGMYDGRATIVEAVWPEVRSKSLYDFLSSEDYLLVLKPTFAKPLLMKSACDFAFSLKGFGYDLFFEYTDDRATNKAFYCSEVIWWSYSQVMQFAGLPCPFTPRLSMGVNTIEPSDFALAQDKFQIIAKWGRK
jgi:hypothetical protein